MKSSTGLALHFMRKGLPRRSWACPVALRGVLKGEGASATTAPKCTKVPKGPCHEHNLCEVADADIDDDADGTAL